MLSTSRKPDHRSRPDMRFSSLTEHQFVPSDAVEVVVTSNISPFPTKRRFSKSLSLPALKNKLELVTGGSASTMNLSLYDSNDQYICSLDSQSAILEAFPVDDGMRLHVEDRTVKRGEYEDVRYVDKFELSDEQYRLKQGTLRAYFERTQRGTYDPEEVARVATVRKERRSKEEDLASKIAVGSRCEVTRLGQWPARGVVRFCGAADFSAGLWVGVELDQPVGRNDGSVNGRRYFDCPPDHGLMTRPGSVVCGDYPDLAATAAEDEDEM